jgi:cytochrome c peroxidase
MLLFVQNGCADCHRGPQLSDQLFHNAGVPPLTGAMPDRGRADGIVDQGRAEFSASSSYSDEPQPHPPLTPTPGDLGAFRTPSLRNVGLTAPYMHNGSIADLADAVAFHLSGGAGGYVGDLDSRLAPRTMSQGDQAAVVDFLGTLQGQYPGAPWNFWPNGP